MHYAPTVSVICFSFTSLQNVATIPKLFMCVCCSFVVYNVQNIHIIQIMYMILTLIMLFAFKMIATETSSHI